MHIADAAVTQVHRPWILYISKWVDYSNKYGFGFQLSDNSVGIMFNDNTRMMLTADNSSVHFTTLLHFASVVDDAKCIVVTRVCVCVSACLSAIVRPHYCTDPDVTWGMVEVAP